MTVRQTRFDHVIAWISEAGPEDLEDLRREIEAETKEFMLAEEEHRIHLAGLRRLESILAERCGEVNVPLSLPTSTTEEPVIGLVDLPAAMVVTAGVDVQADQNVVAIEGPRAGRDGSELDAASAELAEYEREPPVSADDPRSIEERIRDFLKKVGPRSPQQIGAALGIEKSVVYYTLNSSPWFFPGKVNGSSAYQTPWKLTGKGKAS